MSVGTSLNGLSAGDARRNPYNRVGIRFIPTNDGKRSCAYFPGEIKQWRRGSSTSPLKKAMKIMAFWSNSQICEVMQSERNIVIIEAAIGRCRRAALVVA
ncbi:MAG TPA: hypothetical protein VIM98_09980, partial [Dyella sp.]|uniref:hypothetical protein n=1 Tax=Dyella sp. TaxID=1869338 RepID=UPI002F95F919